MGVSAFFWLPLIGERHYLAETAYDISRTVWLPASMWTWDNFLDAGLTYTHTFARPIRLGIVQAALAALGFVLARRRDGEWLFLGGVTLLLALLMGIWALPLWLNIEVLSVIQFAWRLLALLSLPLALFAGGVALHPRTTPLRATLTAATIGLIVFSQQPRLAWMDVFAPETADVSAPVFAQIEVDQGALEAGEGNSAIQEFRPRWADRTLTLDADSVDPAPALDASLLRAGDFGLSLRTRAEQPSALRLTTFYFPAGRRASTRVKPRESTRPPTSDCSPSIFPPVSTPSKLSGRAHSAARRCGGEPGRAGLAGLPSLATRLAAASSDSGDGCAAGTGRLGCFPAPESVAPPAEELTAAGLRLIGYRTSQTTPDALTVLPYWHVAQTPPEGLRFSWSLSDSAGAVVAESGGLPYYNMTHRTGRPTPWRTMQCASCCPAPSPRNLHRTGDGIRSRRKRSAGVGPHRPGHAGIVADARHTPRQ